MQSIIAVIALFILSSLLNSSMGGQRRSAQPKPPLLPQRPKNLLEGRGQQPVMSAKPNSGPKPMQPMVSSRKLRGGEGHLLQDDRITEKSCVDLSLDAGFIDELVQTEIGHEVDEQKVDASKSREEQLVQGIIWSEILQPPLSKRQGHGWQRK